MKCKLRSHPSVLITDNFFLNFIMGIVFINMIDVISEIRSIDGIKNIFSNILESIGMFTIIILVGTVSSLIYSILAWRINYLEIDGDNINIKKEGIFKRNINFKSCDIASINISRSFLERIFNTSTVKIELNNSIETLDEGVKYTFKKQIAEEIVSSLKSAKESEKTEVNYEENLESDYKRVFTIKESIIFSIIKSCSVVNLTFGLVMLGLLISEWVLTEKDIINNFFGIIIIFGKLVFDLIKNAVEYSNFSIKKDKDKITVKHGLIKLKEYSFNLDMITGIKIKYSILGRLLKRGYIEAIVVGLSNDENESATVSLTLKEKDIELYLKEMFNNFSDEGSLYREDVKAYMAKCVNLIIVYIILIMAFVKFNIVIYGTITFIIWLFILFYSYKTNFVRLNSNLISINLGLFDKCEKRLLIKKIQYIKVSKNPVERILGLQHGEILSIADFTDLSSSMPKLKEEYYNEIVENYK